MSKSIFLTIVVSLLALAATPTAATAQKSARIRVGVRIVESPVTEALTATQHVVNRIAQADSAETHTVRPQIQTERGFAHLTTERLSFDSGPKPGSEQVVASEIAQVQRGLVRITVAYTAN